MDSLSDPKHILIVDDYPEAAELLSEVVTDAMPGHFTVDVGTDGSQAVALALAHRPNAAVLDIEMPVMDGLEAGAAIREALDGPPPVLIAMSGSQASLDKANASGTFDHVLAKPVDFDELVGLLDSDEAKKP